MLPQEIKMKGFVEIEEIIDKHLVNVLIKGPFSGYLLPSQRKIYGKNPTF